uniref:Uncharacterized protein n=1 Tax=Arundo donax TaxID=35708 RepID=A0A0A9CQ46_ARUDO
MALLLKRSVSETSPLCTDPPRCSGRKPSSGILFTAWWKSRRLNF